MVVKEHEYINKCPKCTYDYIVLEDFPVCMSCGYEEYTQPISRKVVPKAEYLKGNVFLVSYDGMGRAYKKIKIKVIIGKEVDAQLRKTGMPLITPTCPMCSEKNIKMKLRRSRGRTPQIHTKHFNKKFYRNYHCKNRHSLWLSDGEYEMTWH
tara:strand:+ start:273 stop:728 length:456 start_codon:yes stop_codon:yes gene_type:complete